MSSGLVSLERMRRMFSLRRLTGSLSMLVVLHSQIEREVRNILQPLPTDHDIQ